LSILKVNTIQDKGGNNLLVSDGAGTITSNNIGIGEADSWRVTTSFANAANGTSERVTSNWERCDTSFEKIGTGLSESSGIFTFPSTGIYEITSIANIYSSNDIAYVRLNHMVTTDNGSNYNNQAEFNGHTHSGKYYSSTAISLFDVTDVSTHKIKFQVRHPNDLGVQANTSTTMTTFFFKKLGDT